MATTYAINNLVINPSSGSLDSTIKLSANANTGRNAKTKVITAKTTVGSPAVTKNITVTQAGIAEFIRALSLAYSAANTGSSIAITGTANAVGLSVVVSDWTYNDTPSDFVAGSSATKPIFGPLTVNGNTVTDGSAIEGDPGADAQYDWSVKAIVPANPYSFGRTCTVTISCTEADNVQSVVTISQTANAPTLVVAETITIPASGSVTSLALESNTAWEITQ